MNNKCDSCKVRVEEIQNCGVCIWYMDNVVCGDKNVSDCTMYSPITKSDIRDIKKFISERYNNSENTL